MHLKLDPKQYVKFAGLICRNLRPRCIMLLGSSIQSSLLARASTSEDTYYILLHALTNEDGAWQ